MTRRLQSFIIRAVRVTGAALLAAGTATAAVTKPDMFGLYPNYANSPVPVGHCLGHETESAGAGCTSDDTCSLLFPSDISATCTGYTGGMHKFVDSLPGVIGVNSWGPNSNGTNGLGQGLPLAAADQSTYAGSDYYEIAFVDHAKQMHTDLPTTRLRGFVQLATAAVTGKAGCTSPVNLVDSQGNAIYYEGSQAQGCTAPQYLGPIILAQRDIPVRVKFVNLLPAGAGGNLFIPTDSTYMGAGEGPVNSSNVACDPVASPGTCAKYPENRADVHLHGGATPWISDGTPHQAFTPVGDTSAPAALRVGPSKADVPDMWFDSTSHATITSCAGHSTCGVANATNDPGPGMNTMYYTNQQSARLLFYHDHALGLTRLNVYAGMAGGYLIQDPVEQKLVTGGTIESRPYPFGTGGSVVVSSSSPPVPDLAHTIPLVIQEKTFVPNATGNAGSYQNLVGAFSSQLQSQDPTWDSTNWGGFGQLWYPHVYMPNQNPYDTTGANPMGRWDYGPWFWPNFVGIQYGIIANPYAGQVHYPGMPEPPMMPGTPDARGISPAGTPEAFMDTPVVNGTAYPYIEVEPRAYRFRILSVANDRTFNLSWFVAADKGFPTTEFNSSTAKLCDGTTGASPADCTEVKMVPFDGSQNVVKPFPAWWYTNTKGGFSLDGRSGGVPDPDTRGPAWIQIGTEGGVLPAPVVIKNGSPGFPGAGTIYKS